MAKLAITVNQEDDERKVLQFMIYSQSIAVNLSSTQNKRPEYAIAVVPHKQTLVGFVRRPLLSLTRTLSYGGVMSLSICIKAYISCSLLIRQSSKYISKGSWHLICQWCTKLWSLIFHC